MSLVHLRHSDRQQLLRQTRERLAEAWTPAPGGRYVIKPNLCSEAPAHSGATTDPDLVTALIQHLKDCSAQVSIVELPPHIRNVERVFSTTGYGALARTYGVALINPEQQGGFMDAGPLFEHFQCRVARAALECDGIVNVPKVKSHMRAHFSGAVKNLMGLTDMPTRHMMHVLGIHQGVAELYRCLEHKVAFNVVDAMVGMEGDGPTRGEAVRLDSVVLGDDALQCDLFFARALGVDLYSARYLSLLESPEDDPPPPVSGPPLLDRPLRPPHDPAPTATYLKEALITQPELRWLLQRLDLDERSRKMPGIRGLLARVLGGKERR